MQKKDIAKLFPELPTFPASELYPPPRRDSIVWRTTKGVYGSYIAAAFGTTIEYVLPLYGTLVIGGSRRLPVHGGQGDTFRSSQGEFGLELEANHAWRSIGSGPSCFGSVRTDLDGAGEIRLPGGRIFAVEMWKARPTVKEEGRKVAQLIPSWSDTDQKQRIFCRTWLAPEWKGEDGIFMTSLLFLHNFCLRMRSAL